MIYFKFFTILCVSIFDLIIWRNEVYLKWNQFCIWRTRFTQMFAFFFERRSRIVNIRFLFIQPIFADWILNFIFIFRTKFTFMFGNLDSLIFNLTIILRFWPLWFRFYCRFRIIFLFIIIFFLQICCDWMLEELGVHLS